MQQRGLSGPPTPPQGQPVPWVHREVHALEGVHARLALPVGHRDASAGEQGGGHAPLPHHRGRAVAHATARPSRISTTRSRVAPTRSEWVTTITVLSASDLSLR